MRFNSFAFFVYILFFQIVFHAQIGGSHSFEILNLPFNARTAALGNDFISVKDQDVNLGIQNPSLYNQSMNKRFSYNHVILPSGINYGMLNYARNIDSVYTFSSNLRYVSYGNMDRYNELGLEIGKFYAGDFILGAGIGKKLNEYMSIGMNLNLIYSQLEQFSSFALSSDFAMCYQLPKSQTLLTVLAKNVGYQLKTYVKGNRTNLPTEVQFAISHKLKHAPFRFSILLHHLNKFDLTYNDVNQRPEIDPLTGDTTLAKSTGLIEKTMRHFTYQVEVLLGKKIHIRSAFDYHRRQELKVIDRPGLAGFSFGVGMYFKRFNLDYGILVNSVAGYTNFITLNLNLDKLKK